MDTAKKAAFARKFGKRLHLKKGGMVVRHYDAGGTILGGPGNPTNATTTGVGGIAQGLGLNASSANIQNGTNAAQLNNAYTGTQTALNNQNALTSTLTPQAATAVGNQNTLAAQELAMASGQGPNPAAAQLNQATGVNTANTAALLASQRGASANPALAARTAALAGAQNQQGAAGQAATMEANQAINAQNNLANLSGQQIGQTGAATTAQNTAQQNEQNTLENANTSANNAAVQMQSNINNVNSNASQGILGSVTGALQQVPIIGSLFDEGGEVNSHVKHKLEFVHKMTKMGLAHFDGGGTVSGGQSDLAKGIASTSSKPAGNSNVGTSLPAGALTSGFAGGGQIPAPDWGGQYTQSQASSGPQVSEASLNRAQLGSASADKRKADAAQLQAMNQNNTALSVQANALEAPDMPGQNMAAEGTAGTNSMGQSAGDSVVGNYANVYKGGEMHAHFDNHFSNYFKGGDAKVKNVPAMVSPGEIYLSPEQVKIVIHEGEDPAKIGHKFKGKAKVKGDSLKNDDIPTELEEGGIVIDRKNMDTRHKRELFVHKTMAKHRAGGKL